MNERHCLVAIKYSNCKVIYKGYYHNNFFIMYLEYDEEFKQSHYELADCDNSDKECPPRSNIEDLISCIRVWTKDYPVDYDIKSNMIGFEVEEWAYKCMSDYTNEELLEYWWKLRLACPHRYLTDKSDLSDSYTILLQDEIIRRMK